MFKSFYRGCQVIHNTITYIIITLMFTFNPEIRHSSLLNNQRDAALNSRIYHSLRDYCT